MDSYDVMRALAEHAKTLGWEIPEWKWHDDIDGDSEYTVWLRPAESDDSNRQHEGIEAQ